jgi:hypothetical protein
MLKSNKPNKTVAITIQETLDQDENVSSFSSPPPKIGDLFSGDKISGKVLEVMRLPPGPFQNGIRDVVFMVTFD